MADIRNNKYLLESEETGADVSDEKYQTLEQGSQIAAGETPKRGASGGKQTPEEEQDEDQQRINQRSQEERYLSGAGSLEEQTRQRLSIARRLAKIRDRVKLSRSLAQIEEQSEKTTEEKKEEVMSGVRSVSKSKFAMRTIYILALADDILDYIDLAALGVTLGFIGIAISILITLLIWSIRVKEGSVDKHWIRRLIVVFIVDTILTYILPFNPGSTVGQWVILRIEKKVYKKIEEKTGIEIREEEKKSARKTISKFNV